MARIKFLNFTPRPKPKKRPRRHSKRPKQTHKRMQKKYNRQGKIMATTDAPNTKRCTDYCSEGANRKSKAITQIETLLTAGVPSLPKGTTISPQLQNVAQNETMGTAGLQVL